jgi:8-oxo-dGTP pyrophosphatase MutT (NUDIX family)
METNKDEVTFYEFFVKVKGFLKELLNNPIEAKPDVFFRKQGITKGMLMNKMMDRDIIHKDEDIKEITDDDGNLKSYHHLQYKIPKKNFERKIRRLYTYFFENGKRKKINESKWNPNQEYDSVATYIFCRNDNGEICVLGGKRRGNNNGGKYNVPTGCVGDTYFNESVLDAAVREVKEESGISLPKSLLKDIGDEEYSSRYGIGVGKNFMVILNGTTNEYRTGMGDGENDRFRWIPISAVDKLEWAFNMNKKIHNIVKSL